MAKYQSAVRLEAFGYITDSQSLYGLVQRKKLSSNATSDNTAVVSGYLASVGQGSVSVPKYTENRCTGVLLVGADHVQLVSVVCDLGVYVDSELSLRPHVSHKTVSCFSALRQIRSIRQSRTYFALETLVTSSFPFGLL